MKNKKSNKGITLVALVITIIILLILATISVQSLTNTGLFKKAQEAKNAMEKAEEEQQLMLNEYEEELNKYSGTDKEEKDPIKEVANKVLSTTDNTELTDAYGNKIVVPAGFKIKVDETTNNATTVNQGIVIVDSEKKEFVWIPVGKIYTDASKSDANAKTIELGRYEFDESGVKSAYSGGYVEEDKGDTTTTLKNYGNTIAKSITDFKTSVATNGGYYIGRYEARTTTARSDAEDTLTTITEKGTDKVYNYVTQPQAATLAQNMYNSNKFTSDLMNSYAWDTATVFLQTCGTNATYSRQTSVNTTLSQTGTNTQETKDVQCNVYDMASNVVEWTTETSSMSDLDIPCIARGKFSISSSFMSYRTAVDEYGSLEGLGYKYSAAGDKDFGFRPLLYVGLNS